MTNPVPGFKITTPYKKRGKLWSLGWHTGSDFAAPVGTKIVSATPGTVIAANAYDRSYGYKVIIRWGNYDVWYCHMRKGYATVRQGQKVEAGQQIGKVGDTGNITGPHLHMELRVKGGGFAAANFRDPMIAVNYEEDDMPLSDADIKKIVEALKKDLFNADVVPIEDPIGTPESRAKNPTWQIDSALGVTMREVVRTRNMVADIHAEIVKQTPPPEKPADPAGKA